MNNLEYIRKYPDKCCASVSRGEDLQPCDKVAVAIRADGDHYEGEPQWWPVCAHHTRKGRMVPLADLIRALL